MDFSLSSEQVNGAAAADYVVAVGGEVDLYTAPELKRELHRVLGKGARRIVVDMSDTTFIDSTALGVLLSVVKRVHPDDGSVVLVCPDPNVRRIFEITLLDRVFAIVESRGEAMAELAASGS